MKVLNKLKLCLYIGEHTNSIKTNHTYIGSVGLYNDILITKQMNPELLSSSEYFFKDKNGIEFISIKDVHFIILSDYVKDSTITIIEYVKRVKGEI